MISLVVDHRRIQFTCGSGYSGKRSKDVRWQFLNVDYFHSSVSKHWFCWNFIRHLMSNEMMAFRLIQWLVSGTGISGALPIWTFMYVLCKEYLTVLILWSAFTELGHHWLDLCQSAIKSWMSIWHFWSNFVAGTLLLCQISMKLGLENLSDIGHKKNWLCTSLVTSW